MCLFWGADCWLQSSGWMSSIQDPRKAWLATGNLLAVWWRMPSLGPSVLLSGCGCCPSAPSLQQGMGPSAASSHLVFAQSFVLWVGQQCLKFGLFTGMFSLSLSLFLSLAIPQFGLLSHVSSLRLPSGHSGPVLTLSNATVPPCSAPTCWWWMQVSGLLLHWELPLGT